MRDSIARVCTCMNANSGPCLHTGRNFVLEEIKSFWSSVPKVENLSGQNFLHLRYTRILEKNGEVANSFTCTVDRREMN